MLEQLREQVETKLDADDLETLNNVYDEIEAGEWGGAGDWFGHTDDCFERGMELGRAEAFEEVLNLIKNMQEGPLWLKV